MKKSARKVSLVSKLSKTWNRASMAARISTIVGVLAVTAALFYGRNVQRVGVFEIAPTTSPSPYQQALSLDETAFVSVNNSESVIPEMGVGFTVEAWVRPAEATYSAMTIVSKSNSQTGSFSLWSDAGYNSGEGLYKANYYFSAYDAGCTVPHPVFTQKTYQSIEEARAWHHVAGVIQPDGTLNIFVDGKKSAVNTNSVASLCKSSAMVITIGARSTPQAGVGQNMYRGAIDEVHISRINRYVNDFPVPTVPYMFKENSILLYHFNGSLVNANQDNKQGTSFGYVSYVQSTIPWGDTPVPSRAPSSTPYPSPSAPAVSAYPSPYVTTAPSAYPSPAVSSTPNPSPSSWPPTPPPTSDPSQMLSCTTDIYKLPARMELSSTDPNVLAKYRLSGRTINAKAGERYVIGIALKNIKRYPLQNGLLRLQSWSENPQGESAPYRIGGAGQDCTFGYVDKTVRCDNNFVPFNIGQTIRPKMYEVIDISRVARATVSTVTFKGIYSASTFACPTVTVKVTPTMVTRCTGVWPFRTCRMVAE